MKKLLLVTTAIAGVALMSADASAAVKLDLGGFFRGYGVHADSDETAGAATSLRSFEFRRKVEVHLNGETTLDNGLTIGAHGEVQLAHGTAAVQSDEIYAYASAGWGRVNFGVEDGTAYLLQVEAPSADSNIDGMRVYISGMNRKANTLALLTDPSATLFAASNAFSTTLDYGHNDFKITDRLSYLSPKFQGFQFGASYAPTTGRTSPTNGMTLDKDQTLVLSSPAGGALTGLAVQTITGAAEYEDLIEVSARYDGEFQGFGVAFGAGYSTSDIETKPTSANIDTLTSGQYYIDDGIDTYNVGLNIASQGFSLGGNYKVAESSRVTDTNVGAAVTAVTGDITRITYVVGGAYDNGPYHVGLSYLNQETEYDALSGTGAFDIAKTKYENDKFTVGGGYTFGPGMTFRGSVAWGEFGNPTAASANDFQQVALGADIKF